MYGNTLLDDTLGLGHYIYKHLHNVFSHHF